MTSREFFSLATSLVVLDYNREKLITLENLFEQTKKVRQLVIVNCHHQDSINL